MDAERKKSGVRSIPDKTSTGTRRPVRRSLTATGKGWGEQPSEYRAKEPQVRAGRKKPSPTLPPKVKVERTQKGKRWLSPGEVELHGDVLEVRDRNGKIVDSVLLPPQEEKKPGRDSKSIGEKGEK